MVTPESEAVMPRLDRPLKPERISPTVASWGYRPDRVGTATGIPGWLWMVVGFAALGAVLVAALQIARQAPPLAIQNATKSQLAAAESLATVLRRDSTAVDANVAFGNLYYDTQNFGQAIPYYRRALAKDPSLTDVRVDMGVSYHNSGDLDAARTTLEQATTLAPDHAIAHFDLGVVYQTTGRNADARAQYLQAKSLQHPPEMDTIVAQLLNQLDHPQAAGGGGALPPGHPAVDGSMDPGLPPGHPDVSGGVSRKNP
jgi:predicted negative regulator of RcsB-dependent stress response